jgi:hypothetical protein
MDMTEFAALRKAAGARIPSFAVAINLHPVCRDIRQNRQGDVIIHCIFCRESLLYTVIRIVEQGVGRPHGGKVSLISDIADSTISLIGSGIVKRVLHAIGDVQSFTFDSRMKEVAVRIVLRGEEETTEIRLCRYHITEPEGVLKIRFEKIETTKEWLTAAAEKFFTGRDIEVPEQYAMEVKAIFGEPRRTRTDVS